MATYTQNWFDRHIPLWTEQLQEFKDKKNLEFLEIGAFEGRSAIWLLENFDCNLTVIDTFEGSEEHAGMNIDNTKLYDVFRENIEPYIKRVRIMCGLSFDGLVVLNHNVDGLYNPNKFDLIHIDGSHMSRDVFIDIGLAWNLLKIGGIMICDDYSWIKYHYQETPWMTPKPAIDGFIASYVGEFEIIHQDYQIIFRKIK